MTPTPPADRRTTPRSRFAAVVMAAAFVLTACGGGEGGFVEPTPMRSTLTAEARALTRAAETATGAFSDAATQAARDGRGTRTAEATLARGATREAATAAAARPPATAIAGGPTVTRPPATQPPATAQPGRGPTLAPIATAITSQNGGLTSFTLPYAVGAGSSFWRVWFTTPGRQRDVSGFIGGIDSMIAQQIDGTARTLDIAAYEWNSPPLTQAVLRAHLRGVRVRIVTDDRDGLQDEATTLDELQAAGIPIVTDGRRALMHNKFMIFDESSVLTGSWNYTLNDTYRNNNNAVWLRSRQAVRNFQAEFDEMFADGLFGPRSPSQTPVTQFTQDGVPIAVYFAPEDAVLPAIVQAIGSARQSVRFMAFSYTQADITTALLERARSGVVVQGIFETTGSETASAQLRPLFCAGQNVRQDGNPFILHHKVFIIDDVTVLTGSFNFSANATESNDENLLVIRDPALAAQFMAEYNRRWAEAESPDLDC